MAKIKRVEKSRKEVTCGKCRKVIPVGSSYIYAEPYMRPKMIRCTECGLKAWETSGSDFVQTLGSIQDDWRENYDIEGGAESDIKDALEELRDAAEESLDNMPESLQEGPTGEMLQERIDMLEDAMNELDNVTCFDDVLDEKKDDEDVLQDFKSDNDIDDDAELTDEQQGDFDKYCRDLAKEEVADAIDEALSGLCY